MRLLTCPAVAIVFLLAAAQAPAQTGKSLEDRVKDLEMKESEREKGTGKGADAVGVWWDNGLKFKTENGAFEGRLGAYAIIHYTTHGYNNESDGYIDGFSVKEAGLEVEGRLWKAWEVFIRPRVMPGGTDLYYGWVEFNKWEEIKVRAGIFKEPFSPEVMEDTRWQDLPENSVHSMMCPNRDLGAMVYGSLFKGIFSYYLGVFNGSGAGNDANSDKDALGRIVIRPGATSESDFIKHLYIGAAMTRGKSMAQNESPFPFVSPSTGTVWHPFAPGLTGLELDGVVTRVNGDIVYIAGPFSFKAEATYFKAKVEFAEDNTTFRAHSYYAQIGFWLLQSTRINGHRPDLKPKALFDGGFGDVQLVIRYSKMHIDDTFEEAGAASGSRNVDEYCGGINYYPNAFVRISVMYAHYHYDHQSSRKLFTANGDYNDDENAVILRAQIDF